MSRLRFGAFLPNFHRVGESPTYALEQDLDYTAKLEAMGFDEVFYGEHHSGGEEIIASPELMIAAAAARTHRIRLGTGVCSLPYHHPLILAERILQLHHMTRGRLIFGVGPGALPSDALMIGVDPADQRRMMGEALDVIMRLFRGERVTRQTDWFTVRDGRLQWSPHGELDICVATAISPNGARVAGKYGLGLLQFATQLDRLSNQWTAACEAAKASGHTMDRAAWRITAYVHIAESRERAKADVRHGLFEWLRHHQAVAPVRMVEADRVEHAVEDIIAKGAAVIGDPDDLVARIEALQSASGGFGAVLMTDHNWTTYERKLASADLVARYVVPRIHRANIGREASYASLLNRKDEFRAMAGEAIRAAGG